MIKAQYFPVKFDLDTFIPNELPITYAFFDGDSNTEYRKDLEDLFSFVTTNSQNMPFYNIHPEAAKNIATQCEEFYAAMCHCLEAAFDNHYNKTYGPSLASFFGKTIVDHPYFIDYAAKTWDTDNPAIYGRFDMAVSANTGEVLGFYEFNGDTPVMLFESTSLQNNLVSQVTSNENQYNNFFEESIKDMVIPEGNICIVLDYDYIEDICTCETIKQTFEEAGRTVFISSIKDLTCDTTDPNKPFSVSDVAVDNLFILSPWEELLESDQYSAIRNHDKWSDNVFFFEPAWRWFFSNKGFMAWMTYLAEHHEDFEYILDLEGFLPTYMTIGRFLEEGQPCVGKPVTGRLSSNIVFYDGNGSVLSESGGGYGDDLYVYQTLCKPDQVEGRNNFIMGAWMCPYVSKGKEYNLEAQVGTLCIREFDKEILDIKNERFIPHIVEWQ